MTWITILFQKNHIHYHYKKNNSGGAEDGGEVGGSWAHLLLHLSGTPSHSSEEQSEQPMESQLIWNLGAKDCRGRLKTDCKEIP